jgi:hypothetical protein
MLTFCVIALYDRVDKPSIKTNILVTELAKAQNVISFNIAVPQVCE